MDVSGEIGKLYSTVGGVELQVAVKMLEVDAAVHGLEFGRELTRGVNHIGNAVSLVSPVKIRALIADRAACGFDLNVAENAGRLGGGIRPTLNAGIDLDVLTVFSQDVYAAIHTGDAELVRFRNGNGADLTGVLLMAPPAPVGMILIRSCAVVNGPAVAAADDLAIQRFGVLGVGVKAVEE